MNALRKSNQIRFILFCKSSFGNLQIHQLFLTSDMMLLNVPLIVPTAPDNPTVLHPWL